VNDMNRAEDARAILDNPEFEAAFADIEQGIIERWKATSVTDAEGQRYLKLLHKIHQDYRATLRTRVSSGKMEEQKIKREGLVANLFRK